MLNRRRHDPREAYTREISDQIAKSMALAGAFAEHARELRLAREVCAGRGWIVDRIEAALEVAVEHTDFHLDEIRACRKKLNRVGVAR